jgi:Pvc16 N-terminal domain
MSNFLAVATVTEALRHFIERNLSPGLGFQVTVRAQKPPTEPPAEATITVFCYRASPNAALRNRDAPTRGADGVLLTRPQAVLDLHYLISFYGDEALLQPQQMLGAVVRSMHEWPVLSDADIAFAAGRPFLTGSDLPDAVDRVRFTPTHLDIDDSYKLWTMLSQTPFALSLTYQASVVAIDGSNAPAAGKPVLQRNVRVDAPGRTAGPAVDLSGPRP